MFRTVRRPARAASLCASLALAVLAANASAAPPSTPTPLLPQAQRDALAPTDRIIVRFRDDAPEHGNAVARRHFLERVGKARGLKLSHGRRLATGHDLLRTDRRLDPAAAKQLLVVLARDPRVASVEVDRIHRPMGTPNDPRFPEQWYLQPTTGINAVTAWNRGTGSGAVVAVVDSGLTAHADLAANRVAGYDFISDTARSHDGNGRDANASDPGDWNAYSECSNTGSAYDSSWHGTKVAGLIAATANNGVGIAGVAHAAKIMPVRVSGACGAYTSDIVDAITWASGGSVAGVPANANPAEVINVSLWANDYCSASMQTAINGARSRGAVVVASSHDSGIALAGGQPISCAGVVRVGASDQGKASYSSGSELDILAPGGDDLHGLGEKLPLTTTDTGITSPAGDAYASVRGPSYSTAQVSGVIALIQSIRVNTPDAVAALLRSTAQPQVGCTANCTLGIVDAAAATRAAQMPVLWIEDPAPVVEGNAGTKVLTFTVRLSEALATPVTITVATANGTAAAGGDYVARTFTATIPAGNTSLPFNITLNGDTAPESDDTFFVNLTAVSGVLAVDTQAQGTILNDDLIELTPDEGDNIFELTTAPRRYFFNVPAGATDVVVRTQPFYSDSTGDVDLFVAKTSQPTRANYLCASTAVGNTERCELGNSTGTHFVLLDTLGSYQRVSVYVSWTEPPGDTALSIADARMVEGDDGAVKVDLLISRARPATSDHYFDISSNGGTIDNQDIWFTGQIPGYYIPAGATSVIVRNISVRGDTTVEPNEVLNLVLSSTTAPIADGTAVLTIVDDDGDALMAQDVRANEGGNAIVHVVLGEPATVPVTFSYATAGAGAGTDYTAASGTRTIAVGQTGATIAIALLNDTVVENDEGFNLNISNVTGARLTDAQARVTIADTDTPSLGVADAYIAEGNSGTKMGAIPVTLSKAAPYPVTFTVATSSAGATSSVDYRNIWLEETIPAGMTTKVIHVPILGDAAVEGNEAFNVTLSNIVGAANTGDNALAWILNDEGPLLSINDVTIAEGNAGTKVATFTVSLSQVVNSTVTFDVGPDSNPQAGTATANNDYVWQWLLGANIPAGQLARTFTVTVNGDTVPEAAEFVDILVQNTQGATAFDGRGRLTITNDDAPGLSIADVSVAEGNSGTKSLMFTVSLSGVSSAPVTFSVNTTSTGTATAGDDYVAKSLSGLQIPAGSLSKTFNVTINGDTVTESNETFVAQLANVTGANITDGAALGTIINDDVPVLTIADVAMTEGASGTKNAVFTVSISQPAPYPVTFNIATTGAGTATAGVDYVAKSLSGLQIPPGMVSKTVAVTLNGDTTVEPNETYVVAVTGVTGANVGDGNALGTITNDD